MKKIIIIFCALLNLSSCNFLSVDNPGKSETHIFFKDMAGLRIAKTGLYRLIYSFYDGNYYKYSAVAGDLVTASSVGVSSDMYYQFNYLSTPDLETTAVGYIWKNGYNVVINANTLLTYVDDLKKSFPNDLDEINSIEAQALVIRAMMHFDLVRTYAQPFQFTSNASHLGIPVLTRLLIVGEDVPRQEVKDVYNQILADLLAALPKLDNKGDAKSINSDACKALLARVYLYMGDYQNAINYSTEIINNYSLSPADEYSAMFTNQDLGKEAIFRLTGYYANSSLGTFYKYNSPRYLPSKKLMDMFDSDDIRYKNMKLSTFNGTSSYACFKYEDLTSSAEDKKYYHITVFRLSEIYLIRSEARCLSGDLNGAADDLEVIQTRAMRQPITVSYIDSNDLFESIKIERAKELCFEGHRFFDLARWGDDIVRDANSTASTKLLEYPDYRFALPLPKVELDANPAIIQNEGYN